MNTQTALNNFLAHKRAESFAKSPQITLGEIISKLKACNKYCPSGDEKQVVFNFAGFYPTSLHSWRGIYAELAVGYSNENWKNAPKISDAINMFESAVGRTYTGYKGGDFTMSNDTPVWVDNYGESHSTGIVDVLDLEIEIVLVTNYCKS